MVRVLLVGFTAESATRPPGMEVETLRDMIAAGDAEVAGAGYDVVRGWIGADHAAGVHDIRELLADRSIDVVMIGNGVRAVAELTELFEQVVNAVHELAPQARFAFNVDPPSTLAALRRTT